MDLALPREANPSLLLALRSLFVAWTMWAQPRQPAASESDSDSSSDESDTSGDDSTEDDDDVSTILGALVVAPLTSVWHLLPFD